MEEVGDLNPSTTSAPLQNYVVDSLFHKLHSRLRCRGGSRIFIWGGRKRLCVRTHIASAKPEATFDRPQGRSYRGAWGGGGGARVPPTNSRCPPPPGAPQKKSWVCIFLFANIACELTLRPHQSHAYVLLKYALKYAYLYAYLTVLCLCNWLFLPGRPPPPTKVMNFFSFSFFFFSSFLCLSACSAGN